MAKNAKSARRAGRGARPVSFAKGSDGVLDVTVVLVEAGYASTAIGPIEVFHSAGVLWQYLHGEALQPRFRVRIASIDGGSVTSLCSLRMTPECSIHDIKKTDIIILPASGLDVQERIARNTALLPWLRKWHARGAYIAGICSGVAFLAECGLLDGRQATTHWAVAEELRRRYPKVLWRPEQFVTEDRRRVLQWRRLCINRSQPVSGGEVLRPRNRPEVRQIPARQHAAQPAVRICSGAAVAPHSDDKIKEIEEYLREHFDRDVSIDVLAERVGMGPRNFIRRFKASTGRLPGAYVQMLRVSAAKELLEHGAASIQAVCSKTGYEDIAFFRSLFKRHTGMTPAEYRSRFAQMSFDRGELVSGRPVT